MGAPFENEVKLRYMWRDLERRAASLGIPYRQPTEYPVNSLLTARVALVAGRDGWCGAFTERVFALHWTKNRLIGSEDNLGTALRDLGQDPEHMVALAQSDENKAALKQQTVRAVERGIFGAPSFVIGDELFWGDDRLNEALDWAASH